MGKVYSREELQKIADLCVKHRIIILSDEVYDRLYYVPFTRIATLSPEVEKITLTVGSAGKNFYATGWRVGESYHMPRNGRLMSLSIRVQVGSWGLRNSYNTSLRHTRASATPLYPLSRKLARSVSPWGSTIRPLPFMTDWYHDPQASSKRKARGSGTTVSET